MARPADPGADLLAAVAAAYAQCEAARAYFECVTESGLVDEAILRLAAAERRYAYLVSQAREAGLRRPLRFPEGLTARRRPGRP